MIEGYETMIPQSLWKRVTNYGIPVQWFALWFGFAFLQVVLSVKLCGWKAGLGVGCLTIGGEFLGLRWVTRHDMHWDEARLAQWQKRYASYYDA